MSLSQGLCRIVVHIVDRRPLTRSIRERERSLWEHLTDVVSVDQVHREVATVKVDKSHSYHAAGYSYGYPRTEVLKVLLLYKAGRTVLYTPTISPEKLQVRKQNNQFMHQLRRLTCSLLAFLSLRSPLMTDVTLVECPYTM